MRNNPKITVLVSILAIIVAMSSCSGNTPAPAEDNIATDIVKAEYVSGYSGLLDLLNGFAGIDALPVGEEVDFSIMGVNVGKITVNSYTDDSNYSYDEVFEDGTHPGVANVTVGKDINVSYAVKDGNASFTADMNGGSSLVVTFGGSTIISAELPWNCSADDNGITVGIDSYTAAEYKELLSLGSAFDGIIDSISKEENAGYAPETLSDTESADFRYSFNRTEGTGEAGASASYAGTITTDNEYDVSFSVRAVDNAWIFSAITIDSETIGSSTIDRINTPYVDNTFGGLM